MPSLQISSLIPKRDTIDFDGGLTVEIKSWSELHALDMGYLANLQGKATELIDAAHEDGGDLAAQAARVAQLHPILDAHLLYVMPDLPPEKLEPLAINVKQGILNWWRVQRYEKLKGADEDESPNSEGQG